MKPKISPCHACFFYLTRFLGHGLYQKGVKETKGKERYEAKGLFVLCLFLLSDQKFRIHLVPLSVSCMLYNEILKLVIFILIIFILKIEIGNLKLLVSIFCF